MFRVILLSVCLLVQAYSVLCTDTESCEECKVNFNTERSAAHSDSERCQALKNYISCRTNTSTSWPGCSLTYEDGESIKQYYYATSLSCVLSDTCNCQMTRWMQTQDYYKAKTYKNYVSCLYESVMPACDDVTEPSAVLDIAQRFMGDFLSTKEDCDSRYEERMSWSYSDADKCGNIKEYISCLGDVAANGQGFPLTSTEAEDLQMALDNSSYCEISMTDTCQCQKAYVTRHNTDVCTASKEYVSCSNNSFMDGCKSENSYDVRDIAKLMKRQNCPNEPEYICSGYEHCYIDIPTLSRADEFQKTASCGAVRNYISCLEDTGPTLCHSVNSTIKYMKQKVANQKLYCPTDPSVFIQTPSPYYPTSYPTAYPTSYPTAYPTSYPTAYPTSYPSQSTVTPLVGDQTVLLMYIQAAKMEAEEMLHAAEEALEAINTAQNFLQK